MHYFFIKVDSFLYGIRTKDVSIDISLLFSFFGKTGKTPVQCQPLYGPPMCYGEEPGVSERDVTSDADTPTPHELHFSLPPPPEPVAAPLLSPYHLLVVAPHQPPFPHGNGPQQTPRGA